MALTKTQKIIISVICVLVAAGLAVGLYFILKPSSETVVTVTATPDKIAAFANYVLAAQKNAFPPPLVGNQFQINRTTNNDLLVTFFQSSEDAELPFIYPIRSFFKSTLPLYFEVNTQFTGSPILCQWTAQIVEHTDASVTDLFTNGFNTSLTAAQVVQQQANQINLAFASFTLKDVSDSSVTKIVYNSVSDGSLPNQNLYDPRTTVESNQTYGIYFDPTNGVMRAYQNNTKLGEVTGITFTNPPYVNNSLCLYFQFLCIGDGSSATFSLNLGQNTFVNTIGNDGTTSNLFAADNLLLL